VAFPTETVYGLGADALNEAAVQAIFSAKGRPGYNPLIVHLADVAGVRKLVADWPTAAERLAMAFWPGPVTLVLPKNPIVPDVVTADLPSVAVRVPSHPVAQALLRVANLPVAAPSANRASQLSPTTAQHVGKSLGANVDLILDGGPTPLGIESTVVDLSGWPPVLLRPGLISSEDLEAVLKESLLAPASLDEAAARPSPGMLDRHYSPRAQLKIYASGQLGHACKLVKDAQARSQVVGALLLSPLGVSLQHPIAMPAEPRAYARLLYAALHSLDDLGCDLILVELGPASPGWAGIHDRLQRASR
jgi:L-threonylcarbamoyladenylate synthase